MSEVITGPGKRVAPERETNKNQVMAQLMRAGRPLTLDDLDHLIPHLNRRQIRSAATNVCRDMSGFYRIGSATYVFSAMKLREHRDGRNGVCISCGHKEETE